jgi:hypothetical protein
MMLGASRVVASNRMLSSHSVHWVTSPICCTAKKLVVGTEAKHRLAEILLGWGNPPVENRHDRPIFYKRTKRLKTSR